MDATPRIPSLTFIRRCVKLERPAACDEFIDAIAMLVQCAYEDADAFDPSAFKPNPETTTLVGRARDYLIWSAKP